VRRLDNIDLRLLRVFVILAEAGSFADAQITLNLSQSTLSTHLAALERNLGESLCVRGRKGFHLTPFGEAAYAAAKQLFADIDAFQQRLNPSDGKLSGRLRIGIVDGVVTSPQLGLQSVIHRFMDRGPVFIDLELGTPHDLEQAIADGRRDVVIGPFSQRAPGVTYVALHREEQELFCGRGHPLFDKSQTAITNADIEQSLFSVRGYRHLEDLYRVNHPRASGRVIHMEAQAMLILSGRFIGFLPSHIAQVWVKEGQMRSIRPSTYRFLSSHYAAYRRRNAQQPLIKAFIEDLRLAVTENAA
jgi:DNA-binding transcriptional LysR family regulator